MKIKTLIYITIVSLLAYKPIAKLTSVVGKVYCSNHRGNSSCYHYNDNYKLKVESGKQLKPGDTIFVQDGTANIIFKNKNTIKNIKGKIEIDSDEAHVKKGFFQAFFKIKKYYFNDSFFSLDSEKVFVRIQRGEFFLRILGSEEKDSFSEPPGLYLLSGEAKIFKKGGCLVGFVLCSDTILLKAGERLLFQDFQVSSIPREILHRLKAQNPNN